MIRRFVVSTVFNSEFLVKFSVPTLGFFKMAIKAIERLTMNIMNRRYLRFIMTLFSKIWYLYSEDISTTARVYVSE